MLMMFYFFIQHKLTSNDTKIPKYFIITTYHNSLLKSAIITYFYTVLAKLLPLSNYPGVVPDIKAVQAEREHGFRAATFCPIPVGDSPSSKRMYDVLHFGCIPVVLSDDLVWAFSQDTNGPLNHTRYY